MGDDALILVIDDDATLLRVLEVGLVGRDYRVLTATTGAEALDIVGLAEPDVVVLDLGLPDMDGLDTGRHLRRWSSAPIVVLSGAEDRKVDALEEIADDYLTKPFSMPELLVRIQVALRHRRALAPIIETDIIEIGALMIDSSSHEASLHGEPLDLTPKEFALLTLLARNPGKVLTHRAILDTLWGRGQALDTLRTHVSQLRRKLGGDDADPRLETEPGVGYRLLRANEPRPAIGQE